MGRPVVRIYRSTVAVVLLIALAFSGLGLVVDGQAPPPGDRARRAYTGHGPHTFAAGELVPLDGLVVLNTLDVVSNPVGGLFCQTAPGSSPCTFSHPTSRSFCHGVSLREGVNWNSTLDTHIYIGFPFDRLAPGVRCPQIAPSTTGEITWWPNPDSL